MKLKTGYKISLSLVLVITVAVLCTLPFLAIKKDTIYVYTASLFPSSAENGVIRELKQEGFKVMVNKKQQPSPDSYALWFKNPEALPEIMASPAKINFLYTESYYPLDWQNNMNMPVILTPYRELYEHYMRSNIKSALITLGANQADFYKKNIKKQYTYLYYGDNNKLSPIAEFLKNNSSAKFLGSFWPTKEKNIEMKENSVQEINKILNSASIVVIYNQNDSQESKKIPQKVMEATLAGSLVFSSPNDKLTKMYKENIIIYNDEQDFLIKAKHYLNNPHVMQERIIAAQNITLKEFSSKAFVQRFNEIFQWLKENN